MKALTPKRFAQLFVHLRNGVETAVRLGLPAKEAKTEAPRLLNRPSVKKEIKRLDSSDEQTLAYVKTGLTRLAFGSVNDAVALIFSDEPDPEGIASADLFNISEIKRVKGGGVEVKFFDRQKAMEKLFELDPDLREETKADRFLKALTESARGEFPDCGTDEREGSDEL